MNQKLIVYIPRYKGDKKVCTYDKSGERQTVVNGAVTTPAVQKVASSTGAALALKSPAAAGGMAQLHLRVKCETKPGESLRVVGWLPQMGSWKADKAPEMKTSRDEYPYWSVSIGVPLAVESSAYGTATSASHPYSQ